MIYLTADWQNPSEIETMRSIVGEQAWASIAGMSIHVYCGELVKEASCQSVPNALDEVRKAAGNKAIYVSEWNIPRRLTRHDSGMPHANEVGLALSLLIRSGVSLAAYWPATRIVPSISLISPDLRHPEATGLLFGWLSDGIQGSLIESKGDLPSVAATKDGQLNIFVFSNDNAKHTLAISLPTQSCGGRIMASVMSNTSIRSGETHIAAVPVEAMSDRARCEATIILNPGVAERTTGWEIARVTVDR